MKPIGQRREKISAKAIFLPRDKHYTLPGFSVGEVRRTEKVLGVRLPKAYVELMREQNGGKLRLRGVMSQERPHKWHTSRTVYEFGSIAGVHAKAWNGLTQSARDESGERYIPEGLVAFDGDGHWWLCLDYRKCGPKGEPCITHYDTETPGEFRVAASFESLLRGLIRSDGEYIFAIDAKLNGEELDRLLRGIGCRVGRYKHPGTWDWRKYGGARDKAAYLNTFANSAKGKAQATFAELPPKTQLLYVDVREKDQVACVRELAGALGNRARLVHQPPDRAPVELGGLPVVAVKAVGERKAPAFSPGQAHKALWDGDLARVRELLALGMPANGRHSGDTRTALEIAAIKGHTAVVRLLLKHHDGAALRGDPLGGALAGGHVEIAKMLMKAGAAVRPKHLGEAAMAFRAGSVRLLRKAGLRASASLVRMIEEMEIVCDDAKVLREQHAMRKATLSALGG